MQTSASSSGRAAALLLAIVLALSLVPFSARPASAAATFTVNLPGDAADLTPADNVCDASNAAGRQCTLRAAIQQANAGPERDAIAFNISGPGLKTIRPGSALPTITEPLLIDGYTQPGAKRNTLATGGINAVLRIELDGSNAGSFQDGLTIEAPNTVLRGLVVNRFHDGVRVKGPGAAAVRIEGCFLGTDATGTVGRANKDHGVIVFPGAFNVVVGGTAPAARNLISGNDDGFGVGFGPESVNGRVEGNLIGTDKTGTAAIANAAGVLPGGTGTTVGGNAAAGANTIAFNRFDGVDVRDGTGHRILRNAIFANAGIGIDLTGGTEDATGATANDADDADTGPNNLQNKPVLASATTAGGTTTITGQLNSAANATFVVRFFSNPSGSEGKVFRGQLNVVTGAGGNAAFTFTAASLVPVGHTVTATATSEGGDTSEFSIPRVVG